MSFSDTLERIRVRAEEEWDKTLAGLNAEAASTGNLGAGRRWVGVQAAMLEAVSDFAEKITLRLTELDPLHSPYDSKAFDDAIAAVTAFSEHLESQYADDSKLRPFRGSKPLFETEGMKQRVAFEQKKIMEKKAEFHSRRSFWKWAWGDFRKRLWSGLLLACGAAILWVLQQLAPMIIETFSRLTGAV
ncbi:hypothetical protein [Glycocaulis sp.]